MVSKDKILVVDDEKIVRVKLGRILIKEGYDVSLARDGRDALAILEKETFDLVLSDMVMGDMDGIALLEAVRSKYPGTIFIIITGHGSLATAVQSMRLGAFDYLLKPCDDEELILRVQRGLKEKRLQKKLEVQTRKLEQMAITDDLTGLYSRIYFLEALKRSFNEHRRYKSFLSFMMIDIDHFKRVNDSYGHLVGDRTLKRVSSLINKTIRDTDIIGRYGGEEFGIIQPRTGLEGARITAARILSNVRNDRSLCMPPEARPQRITVSIGIASCPHREISNHSQLIDAADNALYEAKNSGRDRVVLYDIDSTGSFSDEWGEEAN